mmetsp:Transcript_55409/g.127389  ORF Transcript_55409/g.127389 Transcript_55409/m.127389 type:complete len:415 (+) Transcript_55409:31-1275(+)
MSDLAAVIAKELERSDVDAGFVRRLGDGGEAGRWVLLGMCLWDRETSLLAVRDAKKIRGSGGTPWMTQAVVRAAETALAEQCSAEALQATLDAMGGEVLAQVAQTAATKAPTVQVVAETLALVWVLSRASYRAVQERVASWLPVLAPRAAHHDAVVALAGTAALAGMVQHGLAAELVHWAVVVEDALDRCVPVVMSDGALVVARTRPYCAATVEYILRGYPLASQKRARLVSRFLDRGLRGFMNLPSSAVAFLGVTTRLTKLGVHLVPHLSEFMLTGCSGMESTHPAEALAATQLTTAICRAIPEQVRRYVPDLLLRGYLLYVHHVAHHPVENAEEAPPSYPPVRAVLHKEVRGQSVFREECRAAVVELLDVLKTCSPADVEEVAVSMRKSTTWVGPHHQHRLEFSELVAASVG